MTHCRTMVHCSVMPWQWGQLGLTEDGGNRLIKYADAIVDGVRASWACPFVDGNLTYFYSLASQASPNDGTVTIRISIHIVQRICRSIDCFVPRFRQYFLSQSDAGLGHIHVSPSLPLLRPISIHPSTAAPRSGGVARSRNAY